MKFKDIPGHETIKKQLVGMFSQKKLGHAYLFLGPEGNGSLPLAMALSQYVNCQQKTNNDACGICPSCSKASKIIHPDIHFTYPVVPKRSGKPSLSTDYISEWRSAFSANPFMNKFQWMQFINADNKQGNITVDECRNIIKTLSLKSFEGNYKVYIIWMAEELRGAGNVLLKIIEEPPENTLFILIAENQDDLIGTILSRTHMIKIPHFDDEVIENYLINEYSVENQLANKISRIADGNMNAAIQLIGDDGSSNNDEYLMNFFSVAMKLTQSGSKDEVKEMLDWSERISRIGRENQKNFLKYVLFFLRECISLHVLGVTKLQDAERLFAEKFTSVINLSKLEQLSQNISDAHYYIERNANPRILFFNLGIMTKKILANEHIKSELPALF